MIRSPGEEVEKVEQRPDHSPKLRDPVRSRYSPLAIGIRQRQFESGVSVVLPADPVGNHKICRSGYEQDKKVFVMHISRKYIQDLMIRANEMG